MLAELSRRAGSTTAAAKSRKSEKAVRFVQKRQQDREKQ
jgi:hypothetical protein